VSGSERDEIFAEPRATPKPFRFDESVVRVFPDMVRRSVPCYRELVDLTGLMGAQFLLPGSRAYDLGCSLGAVTFSLSRHSQCADLELIAVDKAPAMVRALADRMGPRELPSPVIPVCADLESVRIERASLVVLNLTLQFVPPRQRLPLLTRIREGLAPGGALILSEKVRFEDVFEQALLTQVHEGFKRANGYSELEISQKRAALEQVLIPDTPEIQRERLDAAGFGQVMQWFQCLNFMSYVAWT
jgi:tRNA (cmo5U34)-methyltransferase